MILLMFGCKRFGNVRVAGEDMSVETEFLHVMFLPLWPCQSFVAIDDHEFNDWNAIPIGRALLRSVFMAWVGVLVKIAAMLCLFVGIGSSVPTGIVGMAVVACVYGTSRFVLMIRDPEVLGPALNVARASRIVAAREALIGYLSTKIE